MKRVFTTLLTTLTLLVSTSGASAQSVDFGGLNFNNDIIGWGDMYNLSFTAHNYGTARSMAMGNAFTALGADMVSATINPAGIGMYTQSDVSITPMLNFTKSPTKGSDPVYEGVPSREQEYKDHTERFAMSSIGAIFTVYRGTKALTNFNIGIAYNRIADFNRSYRSGAFGRPYTESMANLFCTLSNIDGLTTLPDGKMPYGNDPYYWGAVLAYKNGLTNKDDAGWFIDRIGDTATIDQFSAVNTRGSIGEYDLTFGFNLLDKIYIGATIGMQSVDYRRNVYYGEDYLYGSYPSGDVMPYQLLYMNYVQRTELSGSGINFKLGITARPMKWLRIGVAYHTPTYYTLSLLYDAEMWSRTFSAGSNPDGYDIGPLGYMNDSAYTGVWEDSGPNAWNFRSPHRLLFGGAVTLLQRIILSVDYERSWYQSVALRNSPIAGLSYRSTMHDVFKGGDTLRVGAEAYLLPFLALRAGYIWSGSTIREEYRDAIFTHPLLTTDSYITCGVGIKFNRSVYLDVAYQYNSAKYTSYNAFYAIDSVDAAQDIVSRTLTTDTDRHIAVVTLGFRF